MPWLSDPDMAFPALVLWKSSSLTCICFYCHWTLQRSAVGFFFQTKAIKRTVCLHTWRSYTYVFSLKTDSCLIVFTQNAEHLLWWPWLWHCHNFSSEFFMGSDRFLLSFDADRVFFCPHPQLHWNRGWSNVQGAGGGLQSGLGEEWWGLPRAGHSQLQLMTPGCLQGTAEPCSHYGSASGKVHVRKAKRAQSVRSEGRVWKTALQTPKSEGEKMFQVSKQRFSLQEITLE